MFAPRSGYCLLFISVDNIFYSMKKSPLLPVLLLLVTAACPTVAHAQLFKQLLNTVKNTASNRANDKASQSTNQVLDKADGATQIKSKTGGAGTTGGTGATGGSGSSATGGSTAGSGIGGGAGDSASTMKALAMLIGGGGVSAADSAAAIKSFMTASGGSGYFFQYQITMNSKKGVSKDTSTSWFTSSGNGRAEMRINYPGVMSGKIITIAHATQRQYSVMLDPDDRTYSLNVIDTALINSGGGENYQVTRVGSETVGGYSCIHSKVVSTMGSGMFKSTSSFDIWTSTSVPGYALFKKMGSLENVKPKMMVALDNAGAGGFFVKMTSGDKDYSFTMLLTRADAQSFPASMFEIPSGYTKSQETMMSQMMKGAKKQ
jgi:Domain of unknown function (DUF4412)